MIRELARRGRAWWWQPTRCRRLNDITIDELNVLLGRLADVDPVLAGLLEDDRIATVASGCDLPLIDLSRVSDGATRRRRQAI